MIHRIFAVRDAKVEAFLQPFFTQTAGSAIRSISEVVNDPQHTFAKHHGDYALYKLGEFDDESGVFLPETPTLVSSLTDLREG